MVISTFGIIDRQEYVKYQKPCTPCLDKKHLEVKSAYPSGEQGFGVLLAIEKMASNIKLQ